MGTAVVVLGRFESANWDAEVYGAIALASRLAALVKNRSQIVNLAYRFWRLDSVLANFFDELHTAMNKPPTEPVTPERIRKAAESLRTLHASLDRIYKASKRAGLTNNSLTARSLRNIGEWNEQVLELGELLDLTTEHQDVLNSIFERASKEKERGEVYDLSQAD